MAEPVNLFTIASFFSETPERVKKGLNSFRSNRVLESKDLAVTQEDKDWVQATLSQLGCFTGIGWILSQESPRTLPIKTFEGLVTNPDYAEAEDKALHLLSSFVVTDGEKQQIRKSHGWASKECIMACDWGILHEPRAKQQYTESTSVGIQERGLFLSDSGLLGGSPDGAVSDNCIVEVKCPWSARTKTIRQTAESRDFYLYLDKVTDTLTLKPTHNYWHQIQGNLHLTGTSSCPLIVWTPVDLVILPILKDPLLAINIKTLEIVFPSICSVSVKSTIT